MLWFHFLQINDFRLNYLYMPFRLHHLILQTIKLCSEWITFILQQRKDFFQFVQISMEGFQERLGENFLTMRMAIWRWCVHSVIQKLDSLTEDFAV